MSTTPSLRERLRNEFGVELPIHGGPGLESAPIVVTVRDLQDAVDVQMRVLDCMGKGSGAAWRLIGQEVVAPEQGVVRAAIESLVARDQEIVTRQEDIYFVLMALPRGAATTSLPTPGGFVDPRSGVRLPSQLGWLHLTGAIDNEPASPGLGWSVAYGAPVMQGTVCVYDRQERNLADAVESQRVIDEFRSAVVDALSANPAAELKHQALFKDSSGRGLCHLAILDLPGNSMSAVLLTALNGCFVKMRLTFDATEKQFGRMAHESMEAFVDAVCQRTRQAFS